MASRRRVERRPRCDSACGTRSSRLSYESCCRDRASRVPSPTERLCGARSARYRRISSSPLPGTADPGEGCKRCRTGTAAGVVPDRGLPALPGRDARDRRGRAGERCCRRLAPGRRTSAGRATRVERAKRRSRSPHRTSSTTLHMPSSARRWARSTSSGSISTSGRWRGASPSSRRVCGQESCDRSRGWAARPGCGASIDRMTELELEPRERVSSRKPNQSRDHNGTSASPSYDPLPAGPTSTSASSGTTASCSARSSGATSTSATSRPSLGIAWAIIQPFLTMVVFSLFFGQVRQVPHREPSVPGRSPLGAAAVDVLLVGAVSGRRARASSQTATSSRRCTSRGS